MNSIPPIPHTEHHHHWMQQALQLAEKALYLSDPNPRVGCILVNAHNQCIGQGFTQAVGELHAEVMALRDACASGQTTKGATAYVTLEPCSHHGRTPPCTDTLIKAGIAQVIIGAVDPNPLVCGQGIEQLRNAGIHVQSGVLAEASKELNIGFFTRMQQGHPWVRLKMACSLDGKTALNNGQSQWITSKPARDDGHLWRARASAILTGIGTVLADNPQLNVRAINVPRQPWHAIIDTHLQTPASAALLQSSPKALIYTTSNDAQRQQALQNAGAMICRPLSVTTDHHIDLTWLLHDLATRECNELHVEAGSTLSSILLKADLIDELLIYMAPCLLGEGKPLLSNFFISSLSDALNFQLTQTTPIGSDIRLLARRQASN